MPKYNVWRKNETSYQWLLRQLLREDTTNASVKSTSSSSSSNDENKPDSYGEYLDAQVKNAQNQKVNFAKADDNTRKNIAKNYAKIAKAKFKDLNGLPSNDNEADNMLKASINKNAMEMSSDSNANDEAAAAEAQKEIDNLTKSLTESTKRDLSESANRMIESYNEKRAASKREAEDYFSKTFREEDSLDDDYLSLKNVFF